MAEQESGQERTEEATPKRKEEARKKGQVPRSRELSALAVMLLGAIGCMLTASYVLSVIHQVFRASMSIPREAAFDTAWMARVLADSLHDVFVTLIPFFLILLVTCLVVPPLMGGWIFSAESIKPKLSKLDPIKGFKKMFSAHGLMELIKALGKFLVVGATGIFLLFVYYEDFIALGFENYREAIAHGVHILGWSFFVLCCSLFVFVVVDIPFQLYQHNKQLKMTKQEVKDEYKDTEGKPEVKSRIRQLQREMANRRMMEAVPDADVVITNPTHFAVALKYDPDTMRAPVLLAKGADQVAENIKKIARHHNIVIITAPPLARSIYYHTKLDAEIPHGLYVAVAQILAYVFQLKNYQRGQGPSPGDVPDVEVPDYLRKD